MIEIDEIKTKLRRYYTWIETNIKIENSLEITNLNISLEDFINFPNLLSEEYKIEKEDK